MRNIHVYTQIRESTAVHIEKSRRRKRRGREKVILTEKFIEKAQILSVCAHTPYRCPNRERERGRERERESSTFANRQTSIYTNLFLFTHPPAQLLPHPTCTPYGNMSIFFFYTKRCTHAVRSTYPESALHNQRPSTLLIASYPPRPHFPTTSVPMLC